MYYELLYVISSLDRLSVVLICAGMVFETLVLYGLEVQYFRLRYSDIMSYDNSMFNISALMFSICMYVCISV